MPLQLGKDINHLETLEAILGRRSHKFTEFWRRDEVEGTPTWIDGFGDNVKSKFWAKYIDLQEQETIYAVEGDEECFRRACGSTRKDLFHIAG